MLPAPGTQSRRLASRFALLGLMSVVLSLPYAVPPLGDWLLGRDPAQSLYLTKPVENQFAFLPIAVFGVAFVFLVWRAMAPSLRLPRNSLVWLAVLFVGCQFLSTFVAPSWGVSIRALLLPLAGLSAFLVVQAAEPDRRAVEKLMLMALVAAIPAGLYALAQSRGWEILPYYQVTAAGDLVAEDTAAKQQVSSTFGHPNYMASYMAPLVFWALYFILTPVSRIRRVVGLIGFFVLLAALLVAGTRGAWLAIMFAAVPFYVALALTPAYRRQLLFAGGMAAVLAGLMLVVPNPFLRAGFDVRERLMASKEITYRLYYWTAASRMLRDNPVLGIGYGSYDPLFFDYAVAMQRSQEGPEYEFLLRDGTRAIRPIFAHNDHLQIATEGGLVTGLAWIALWTAFICQTMEVIRRGRRNAPVALFGATFLAAGGAMAIDGLASFPFHLPVSGYYFWLLLGTWAAWHGYQRRMGGRPEQTPE